MRDCVDGDGQFHPAFDMPLIPEEAYQVLLKWGDPSCMTFSAVRAKRVGELLNPVQSYPLYDATAGYRAILGLKGEGNARGPVRDAVEQHLYLYRLLPDTVKDRDQYIAQLEMFLRTHLS